MANSKGKPKAPQGTTTKAEAPKEAPQPKQKAPKVGNVYFVNKGDTLATVAARYGTTQAEILKANPFLGYSLRHNTEVSIPDSAPVAAIYTVEPGDTLEKIAEAHSLDPDHLATANPQIRNPKVLYVGDELKIPRI